MKDVSPMETHISAIQIAFKFVKMRNDTEGTPRAPS